MMARLHNARHPPGSSERTRILLSHCLAPPRRFDLFIQSNRARIRCIHRRDAQEWLTSRLRGRIPAQAHNNLAQQDNPASPGFTGRKPRSSARCSITALEVSLASWVCRSALACWRGDESQAHFLDLASGNGGLRSHIQIKRGDHGDRQPPRAGTRRPTGVESAREPVYKHE